ncbi:leucine-rich repeat domain-containing protein [Flavobacterium sp. N1736]|uniref:leucine-rich repeat domain-containing protein n=1 Tax=Flavobacterium sp. N1736 TaxID=2986823 RepID=UPI002224BEC7|nr:leucine-rich repeat domain-containing protein [Flavobacterium sp. N1736]
MRTKLLLLLLLANFSIYAQYTSIPDINFENKLIALGIDSGVADGKVLTANVTSLTTLDISYGNISNLTGIQDFTSLKTLNFSHNLISNVDLSKNVALTSLDCSINKLTALNISSNVLLKELLSHNNQLTTIDVSKNIALETFHTGFNKLTSLNVSKNTALIKLTFEANQLQTIDVSKNTLLTYFICNNNLMKNLDLSKNTALIYFLCNDNNLTSVNLKNGKNTLLDNIINFTNNPNLTCIQVDNIAYSNTFWSQKDATAVFSTDCAYPYTVIPDIKFEEKLAALGIDTDGINGKVLTSNITPVTELSMQFSSISNLTGIQAFENLTALDCSNNNLTSLDLSKNISLTTLNCDSNKLTSLNLSKNINLKKLDCNVNLLTSLDVSKNTALTWLYCYNNKLTSLIVTKNILLDDLYFSDNKLTTIDLSKNPLLISLYCHNNLLTNLDVSKNPKLIILYAVNNQLLSLDVSKNPALTNLSVLNNKLVELNLKNGNNTILNSSLNFKTNPNLTCIQVDNAAYSNANWSTKKDATAAYNETCVSLFTLIPDINFENKLISLGFDSGTPDGKVLTANIANIETLQIQASSISDLTGIQDFKSLKTLDCSGNNLTNLDVTKNTALTFLQCPNNKLTTLDISKNIHLSMLNCISNNLTALDVSLNVEITYLYCAQNLLTSLNVTKNILLDDFYFAENKLTTIDLSQNPLLLALVFDNNYITNLDISKNTKLLALHAANNQLSRLDLSKHTALKELILKNNNLVELNLKNGNNPSLIPRFIDFTNNPNLTCILVDDVAYSNLNWSDKKDATANYTVLCDGSYTLIPDINFEKKLISRGLDLGIPDGKVLTANIASVTDLDLYKSSISDLTGIEGFTALETLYCGDNQITTLDFSKNTKLKQLECYQNKLTSLNLNSNPDLWYLDCFSNKLTTLDLSQNKLLETVYCYDNLLTNLNVSSLKKLESLDCPDNQLTNLDVSTNTGLKQLHCYRNKLKSLDISKNIVLSDLVCFSNELTYLNVKNGNNTNFVVSQYSTKFTINPNLSCIEVDNASYSNTNWSAAKDATANFSTDCSIFYVAIPDQNFEQKLIDLGIDTDGLNGKITASNISSITSLDLSNSNISDLSGIENFTSLTYLNLRNNQLKSLDVSKNALLEILDVSSNQLTTLDLSKNTKLTIVYITNNPLISLNLRNGNNKNFILPTQTAKQSASGLYTTFLGLTTLGCIQVDDADYSNANWSQIKEATTIYSNTCKTLGVDDSVFAKATIYPNPTNGEVNIGNIILDKANVYNELGQLVKTFTLDSNNTNNTINLSGLSKGVYYIYLINQDAASAKKIIVE